jgi:hypothetical protein
MEESRHMKRKLSKRDKKQKGSGRQSSFDSGRAREAEDAPFAHSTAK